MKLYKLKKSKGSTKKRFFKGRGTSSGNGKTCGKGNKGQRSRSGHMKLGFEGGQMPFYRRLPKVGFKNIFKNEKCGIVNVCDLNNFNDNEVVTIEKLKQKHLINKDCENVKILGTGTINKKVQIQEGISVSAKAKEKIEKNGGVINIK